MNYRTLPTMIEKGRNYADPFLKNQGHGENFALDFFDLGKSELDTGFTTED